MQVISVVNTKGGAGKSTIATNLATSLAMKGKRVLIIDTDKRQNSALSFAQIRNANTELADIASMAMPVPNIFKDIRNHSYDNFDYVVIDAGAGDNKLVRDAILCGSYGMLLIPAPLATFDYWATNDTFDIIDECRPMFPDSFNNNYIVFNNVPTNDRMINKREVEKNFRELCVERDIKIVDSIIYNRIAYQEAVNYGMNTIEYTKFKKKEAWKAGREVECLTEEVLRILNGVDAETR